MKQLTESEWGDLFHYILPDVEISDNVTQFRAHCQIRLGRWMAAREAELEARSLRAMTGDEAEAAGRAEYKRVTEEE